VSIPLDLSRESRRFWTAIPIRWSWLVSLLVLELMVLTLSFDTEVVSRSGVRWLRFLEQTPRIPTLAIAVAVATVLFGGRRLRDEYVRLEFSEPQLGRTLLLLAGHLACFAGFNAVTAVVLGGDLDKATYPVCWIAAWAALGATSLGCWAALALPIELWRPLLRRGAGALLTGLAVGVAAWVAGLITTWAWRPLGLSTLWTVRGLLGLVASDVVCDPSRFIMGTSRFAVEIAPECSGYEGIGLIWIFLGAYIWLGRSSLRFPAALLLLPLGTIVIWLCNAVRITALIALGTWGSAEIARQGFHSQAGWLAFNAVALGLIAVSRHLPWFAPAGRQDEAEGRATLGLSPTVAYLGPMMAIAATAMITAAFSSGGFDWLYPLRLPAAAAALALGWRHYADLRLTWSWTAVAAGVLVFAVWVALEPAPIGGSSAGTTPAGLTALPAGLAAFWVGCRVLGSVITVPLAEELAFRGYLMRRLIAADFTSVPVGRFTWASLLISSALFGTLHGRWLAGTIAGLIYALALYRRRELTDVVLAHATTNALIAGAVVGTGAWGFWV
jgi:exosortase E/protease (VPEID-CTERM system)